MPPAKLPIVSGRETVKALVKAGWDVARQRGSHIVLTKEGSIYSLSVPDHREVAKGTLQKILKCAGLSVEEFIELLR